MINKKVLYSVLMMMPMSLQLVEATKSLETNDSRIRPNKACALTQKLEKLFQDPVWWTREYFFAQTLQAANGDASLAQLLKNQVDIGTIIRRYFDANTGTQLTNLLKLQTTQTGLIIKTSIAGGTNPATNPALALALTNWRANASTIADFLHAINPQEWAVADWKAMLFEQLTLTARQAAQIINHDYVGAATTFDAILKKALEMADELARGIVAQSPQKFDLSPKK